MLNKTCQKFELLDQYSSYLSVIKGRAEKTINEYRTDILMFFQFVSENSKDKEAEELREDNAAENEVDIKLIKSITLADMYSFISYCHNVRKSSVATKVRKIVAIRQFWKYLKTKVHLIENNIAEELEIPQIPKRIPKYLSLEDSVRLLITCESSIRNYCIITLFLNCALRLSELVNINLSQLNSDVLTIVGKGNKERKIFLTPATKRAIYNWLPLRKTMNPTDDALFITRKGTRITKRAVQDMIKKSLKGAGLDTTKLSVHKLRHTAATLMYRYGKVDIRLLQKILGHESVATTEIYTHVDEIQLQAAVNSNPLATMFNS